MRKIIYSPGFGAGWVTWMSGSKELKQFALTYQPFIEEIEKDNREQLRDEYSPVVVEFKRQLKERFPDEDTYVYFGGLEQAVVAEVDGPVLLREYDGSESFSQVDDTDWL